MANKNGMEICSFCKKNLENAGIPALNLYLNVCFAHEKNKRLVIKGGRSGTGGSVVRWLEKNKFICSQDIFENFIILKPAGPLSQIESRFFYCNDPKRHLEKI